MITLQICKGYKPKTVHFVRERTELGLSIFEDNTQFFKTLATVF